MNCYYHPDRPAVIQCKNCGKGFCKEDADGVIDGLCPECRNQKSSPIMEGNSSIDKKEGRKWYRNRLILSALFGIVCVGLSLFYYPEFKESLTTTQAVLLSLIWFPVSITVMMSLFYTWRLCIIIGDKISFALSGPRTVAILKPAASLTGLLLRFLICMIVAMLFVPGIVFTTDAIVALRKNAGFIPLGFD